MSEAKKCAKIRVESKMCKKNSKTKTIPSKKKRSTSKPRQNEQTNNWPTILIETEYFPLKKFLVRFESRTFAVLDVFVISRLSEPGTPRKMNTLKNH